MHPVCIVMIEVAMPKAMTNDASATSMIVKPRVSRGHRANLGRVGVGSAERGLFCIPYYIGPAPQELGPKAG